MNEYSKNPLEYKVLKEKALATQRPYKQVQLADIRYLDKTSKGDNILTVQGQEFLASNDVIESLDKLAGINSRQRTVVHKAGGANSLRDFRNYLSSAKAKSAPKGYVAYLNPKGNRVERVLPIIGSVISLEAFFSLAEMFMHEHGLQPQAIESFADWRGGITLRMGNIIPDVTALRNGEEFEFSGYYMRWTGNQIELGLYVMRIVCSNGQTVTLGRSNGYRITSLDPKEVATLMGIPRQNHFLQSSFDQFGKQAEVAMVTPASLGELQSVNKMLRRLRIPQEECDRIAPYEKDLEAYRQKGFKHVEAGNAVSSVNSWDLYNRLTAFATHTDIWGANDLSRDLLRQKAAEFLSKPREIKSYVNIFK